MAIGHLYRDILASGQITAADVAGLQEEIQADGLVDSVEAEILFRLGRECEAEDGSWLEFFVDTLTDFYVWHQEPRGYISDEQGEHLLQHILEDGRIAETKDLELLVNIVYWAGYCPADLSSHVLKCVWDSVVDPDRAVYGHGRLPNVIDEVDVEILRMAIYAPSVDGGLIIDQTEAELLFELNNKAVDSANFPSWRELFVMAVANFLMFPEASRTKPTESDLKRREAWLSKRRGVGSLLHAIDTPAAAGENETAGAFASDVAGEREWRREAMQRAASAKEVIEAPQAEWLTRQVDGDGLLHRNEKYLLEFIRKNSLRTPPSLDPLFARAGL